MQQEDEKKLRAAWDQESRISQERVERGIKAEEDKVLAQLEAERKKREEEERKRQEEEERQRAEQERKLQEQLRKRKEEEEAKKQAEREAEEKRMQEELDKQKAEQLKAEESQRKQLGMVTAARDWSLARDILKVRLPFTIYLLAAYAHNVYTAVEDETYANGQG